VSRFYVPKEFIKEERIFISGDEAHHILDVMRLKVSDEVLTFDGAGNEYAGYIKEIGRGSLVVEITKTSRAGPAGRARVTLIQAIPKKEKMDYIVEKSTELGVQRIVPAITARTIVDWDEKKRSAHLGRWQKIAKEASKQCGRSDIPSIEPVKDISAAFRNVKDHDLRLIAALSDKAVSIKDALKGFGEGTVAVAIGPEGDFTADEIREALEKRFKLINLGPRILKSDTAGLALLSILNYEFSA